MSRQRIDQRAPALPFSGWAALLLLLLLLRLAFAVLVPPNMDEAYYFAWGEHLQLSYVDHAPMVGWLSALARPLGTIPLAVHVVPLFSFGLVVLALKMHEQADPGSGAAPLAMAASLWLSSPLFMALSIFNYPDHVLIGFSALALVFFARWVDHARRFDLYAGAVALGLAGLSKYSAVLLGIGLVATLLAMPGLRRRLRDPHVYGAAGVSLLLMSPIAYWNLTHGLPTLLLHGEERFGTAASGLDLLGPVRLLLMSLVFVSPLALLVGSGAILRRTPGRPSDHLMRSVFLCGTLPFFLLSLWAPAARQVAPHWLAVGLVPVMLALPRALARGWPRRVHIAFGITVMGLALAYYGSAPLLTDALGIADREATSTFGQDQLADAVQQQQRTWHADLVALPTYVDAARLAFARGTSAGLVTLDRRIDQFDLWQPPRPGGQTAIVVLAAGWDTGPAEARFERLTPLRTVITERFGRPLREYRLFLGTGFKAD